MPAISLMPGALQTARLTLGPAGSEWLEFDAALSPAVSLRFAGEERSFPARGTVSIRRGPDHSPSGERVVDSFRYIGSCTDDDTGEQVDERFGVTLFLAEAAFDRLAGRLHWGLPALVLFFDAASPVITARRGGGIEDLDFDAGVRAWEKVASATLTQRPAGATA